MSNPASARSDNAFALFGSNAALQPTQQQAQHDYSLSMMDTTGVSPVGYNGPTNEMVLQSPVEAPSPADAEMADISSAEENDEKSLSENQSVGIPAQTVQTSPGMPSSALHILTPIVESQENPSYAVTK